jgi:hypothetical protein
MEPAPPTPISPADVIRTVRWRYRICSYLFNTGGFWMLGGTLLRMLSGGRSESLASAGFTIFLIGFGILTAAFAVTLAIYRCPVCDHYLSRFRREKDKCDHCGAVIRLTPNRQIVPPPPAPRTPP